MLNLCLSQRLKLSCWETSERAEKLRFLESDFVDKAWNHNDLNASPLRRFANAQNLVADRTPEGNETVLASGSPRTLYAVRTGPFPSVKPAYHQILPSLMLQVHMVTHVTNVTSFSLPQNLLEPVEPRPCQPLHVLQCLLRIWLGKSASWLLLKSAHSCSLDMSTSFEFERHKWHKWHAISVTNRFSCWLTSYDATLWHEVTPSNTHTRAMDLPQLDQWSALPCRVKPVLSPWYPRVTKKHEGQHGPTWANMGQWVLVDDSMFPNSKLKELERTTEPQIPLPLDMRST